MSSFPSDLISKVGRPKDRIQQQLQVVTRRGVAVQVEAAGRLQHPPKLHQAGSHHRHVGQHVVRPQQLPEGLHRLGYLAASLDRLFIRTRRCFIPMPGVPERFDLGSRLRAVFLLKQDVVGLVAIEGRVEINQVSTLVPDIATENVQVVAVVQRVGSHLRQAVCPALANLKLSHALKELSLKITARLQ